MLAKNGGVILTTKVGAHHPSRRPQFWPRGWWVVVKYTTVGVVSAFRIGFKAVSSHVSLPTRNAHGRSTLDILCEIVFERTTLILWKTCRNQVNVLMPYIAGQTAFLCSKIVKHTEHQILMCHLGEWWITKFHQTQLLVVFCLKTW